jgi:hypothetical protein
MTGGSGTTDMDDVPYILTAAETVILDVLYFATDVYSACTGAASDFAKVKRFQELADKIAHRNRIIIE